MPEAAREALLAAIVVDWRGAELSPRWRVLAEYAEKLTLAPQAMSELDLAPLRAAGLSDAAIHDAIQAIAYFNYINRIAEGVHVDLEPDMPPRR